MQMSKFFSLPSVYTFVFQRAAILITSFIVTLWMWFSSYEEYFERFDGNYEF